MPKIKDKQLRPQDLHVLRAELAAWLQSPRGQDAWAMAQTPEVALQERTAAHNWGTAIQAASLTYANTAMTRLALAAGDALPDYRLVPADLPDPQGMIFFEEPITQAVELNIVTACSVVAASWTVQAGLIHIRWWSPREEWITDWTRATRGEETFTVQEIKNTRALFPHPIVSTGTSTLHFQRNGSSWPPPRPEVGPAKSLTDIGEHYTAVRRLLEAEKTLVSAWKLMRQSLVTDTPYEAPRGAVKQLGRLDPALLMAVRYVALRHRKNSPQESGHVDGPKREYAHSWLVRGHWRTLHRDTHQERDVWVRWHAKGPEDAPLLDPSKLVQLLRR